MDVDSLLRGLVVTTIEKLRAIAGMEPSVAGYARLREHVVREACLSALSGASNWLELIPVLPYGRGLDERVVEYPWIYSRLARHVRLLDVGSTLNVEFHIEHLRGCFKEIVFLNPYTDDGYRNAMQGISYISCDIRNHWLSPASFGQVTCISTLEHIGCDNSIYGGPKVMSVTLDETRTARASAMRSIRVLLEPGGSVLLTVPFGQRENHGWFVQFDANELDHAINAFQPSAVDITYFLYAQGWRLARANECTAVCYGKRTWGASAVACIELKS